MSPHSICWCAGSPKRPGHFLVKRLLPKIVNVCEILPATSETVAGMALQMLLGIVGVLDCLQVGAQVIHTLLIAHPVACLMEVSHHGGDGFRAKALFLIGGLNLLQ